MRDGEKAKHGKHILSGIVVAVLAVVGLALVLYPTVANRINQAGNGKSIEDYRREVGSMSPDRLDEMMEAARLFNEELARETPFIGELTREKREVYDSLLDVTGNGIMGYIEVPKSDIYLAIYHGTDESVLQTGVGHLPASSLPVRGESVHTVLTGHSGLPSARLFTDIDRLEKGDIFSLHVLNDTLTYEVESIRRVLPEELESMRIEKGEELCTLLTCTPYGVNTHRLAVTGRRIDAEDVPTDARSVAGKVLGSTWNRMYVFLPPVALGCVAVAVILIRAKIRRGEARGKDLHGKD